MSAKENWACFPGRLLNDPFNKSNLDDGFLGWWSKEKAIEDCLDDLYDMVIDLKGPGGVDLNTAIAISLKERVFVARLDCSPVEYATSVGRKLATDAAETIVDRFEDGIEFDEEKNSAIADLSSEIERAIIAWAARYGVRQCGFPIEPIEDVTDMVEKELRSILAENGVS